MDTAKLSTVAVPGTTTKHGLCSQPAVWRRWTRIEQPHLSEFGGLPYPGVTQGTEARPGPRLRRPPPPADLELLCVILRNATQKQLKKLTVYMQWL